MSALLAAEAVERPLDEGRHLTAFHEAGHAVTYIERGYSFRYVTLRPREPGVVGLVRVHRPRRLPIWDMSAITLAGPVAEAMAESTAGGEALDDAAWAAAFVVATTPTGSHSEVDEARGVSATLGTPFEVAAEGTAADLRRAWSQVEAVAQGLIASPRRMTYRQVLTLMGES